MIFQNHWTWKRMMLILLMCAKAYYLADEKDKAKVDIDEYLSRKRKLAYDAGREEIYKHIGVMPEEI